jgi:Fic family protein
MVMGRGARGAFEKATWTPDFARGGGRRPQGGEYERYIPALIADATPSLSASTATLSERAGMAVRDLNEHAASLASLEGLGRQLMRSEALASSWIEGLQLSHRKLAQATIPQLAQHKASEVMGNVNAMERAVEIGARLDEFTPADIKDIHRRLAVGQYSPIAKIAGEFRNEQGWIGGTTPVTAKYVGPPREMIEELMEDLCQFMNRDDISPVTQAAVAHAQFELIHPFGDGNGRVGRALIHTIFRRRGLAKNYVPPISIVLGANKDAYIAGMDRYQESQVEGPPSEKLDEWITHFARAVETSARHAQDFSDQVHDLQQRWRAQVGQVRSDAAVLQIIAMLPSYPYITTQIGMKETGKTRRAVLDAFEVLEGTGALTRHRNQRKGDSWEAKELFTLLDEFEHAVGPGQRTPIKP